MHLNEALEILKTQANLKNVGEFLDLKNALGRVLTDDIIAIKDLPCFDNSALDGYAVKFKYKDNGYIVKDTIFAGDKRELSISDNECIKIMTGAKFPNGADTILKFEDSEEKDGRIYPIRDFKEGDAHRLKGEEVKIGQILIKKDTKLEPTHIMLLASQGISQVKVNAIPKIAIYSSGDEIKEPWQIADSDEIYNANAFGVSSLLAKNGFFSSYLGIIKDDLAENIKAFENADSYDIIICSGGASKGEADFMKEALMKLGFSQIFDRISIRPGAPTKAFKKDNKIAFILPGNPMAAYICALLIVIPFLKNENHEPIKATCKNHVKFKKGRLNVVLGTLKNGEFIVTADNKYGSGMITPLTNSNAIYLTNLEQSEVKEGEEIFVIRIS